MDYLPLQFPNLPPCPVQDQWSHNVQEAYRVIRDTYDHTKKILSQEDHDSVRLRVLSDAMMRDTLPLLEALDLDIADDDWAEAAAQALATQLVELERAATTTDG